MSEKVIFRQHKHFRWHECRNPRQDALTLLSMKEYSMELKYTGLSHDGDDITELICEARKFSSELIMSINDQADFVGAVYDLAITDIESTSKQSHIIVASAIACWNRPEQIAFMSVLYRYLHPAVSQTISHRVTCMSPSSMSILRGVRPSCV
jgi:hypothetical protein